jgi:hypothetical protein
MGTFQNIDDATYVDTIYLSMQNEIYFNIFSL